MDVLTTGAATFAACSVRITVRRSGLIPTMNGGHPWPMKTTSEISSAVTDLWIDGNQLYVGAGPFGVHVLNIDPPCLGAL